MGASGEDLNIIPAHSSQTGFDIMQDEYSK
jgi:hypothetical protein